MVRRTNTTSKDLTKEICVEKFQEWWDIDELKGTLRFMTSQSVFDLLKNGKKDSENFLDDKQNVAELLFDSIGPRFLHTVLTEDKQEHVNRTKQFWVKIKFGYLCYVRETILICIIRVMKMHRS